jgi:hypothetical protein
MLHYNYKIILNLYRKKQGQDAIVPIEIAELKKNVDKNLMILLQQTIDQPKILIY